MLDKIIRLLLLTAGLLAFTGFLSTGLLLSLEDESETRVPPAEVREQQQPANDRCAGGNREVACQEATPETKFKTKGDKK